MFYHSVDPVVLVIDHTALRLVFDDSVDPVDLVIDHTALGLSVLSLGGSNGFSYRPHCIKTCV